ncbi:hypothetical protein N656DRAFT_187470 [Canariomyces notabilis]|uniref:Uncharacterized protein n=1 Tax=Canariomyces notabilis TaxID=2074819 RepID=A0AAN6TB10_9PEZI|nr:hypothetical protein N656DRAFT_187470 [Canariomyces arenarius]
MRWRNCLTGTYTRATSVLLFPICFLGGASLRVTFLVFFGVFHNAFFRFGTRPFSSGITFRLSSRFHAFSSRVTSANKMRNTSLRLSDKDLPHPQGVDRVPPYIPLGSTSMLGRPLMNGSRSGVQYSRPCFPGQRLALVESGTILPLSRCHSLPASSDRWYVSSCFTGSQPRST